MDFIKDELKRRQTRRTRTGDQFVVGERIEFLVPEHWDRAAAAGGVFFRRDLLSAMRTVPPEGLGFRYGLIYREGQPICCVLLQILDQDLSHFLPKDSPFALGAKAFSQRLFICGSLLCWGNRAISVAPDVEAKSVWPSVAELLYRVRRAEKLSGDADFLLVRDVPEGDEAVGELRDYGYRPVDVEPDMVLDLKDWKNYDDYLSCLSSKYRKAAKSIRKKLEKGGCKLKKLEDFSGHSERIHELYRAVLENAKVRPVEFHPEYFSRLAEVLGAEFAFMAILQEDKLLGYVTVIKDGETAIGYILGFDRAAAEKLPIYLRLLQAVIEQALSWECRRVSFGGTALEPKSRLGATAVARQVWARHRVAPMNALVGPLLEGLSPQQPPDRNPFKAESPVPKSKPK